MSRAEACARARACLYEARKRCTTPTIDTEEHRESGGHGSSEPCESTPSQERSLLSASATSECCSHPSRKSARSRVATARSSISFTGAEERAEREQHKFISCTGNRICSMDSFVTDILPCVRCPSCLRVGVLLARAEDEVSLGVAGIVVLHCLKCKRGTLSWDQSKGARRLVSASGKPQPGPTTRDLNLRAVLGSMQVGLAGQGQLEKLFGILDLPSLNRDSYEHCYERHLRQAVEEACEESLRSALAQEKLLSLRKRSELRKVTCASQSPMMHSAMDETWKGDEFSGGLWRGYRMSERQVCDDSLWLNLKSSISLHGQYRFQD